MGLVLITSCQPSIVCPVNVLFYDPIMNAQEIKSLKNYSMLSTMPKVATKFSLLIRSVYFSISTC